MALKLALRTDLAFKEIVEFLESKQSSGFAVREVSGDNEHWHWYLELDGFKNVQSFRVQLTKKIPEIKGNGSYSVKETDDTVERYWQYMCKGEAEGTGADVKWRQGLLWTDERIEELHRAYWAENQTSKRRKLAPVLEVVYEKLRAAGTAWRDREAIAEVYIKELFLREKPINLFSVKSAVNLLQVKLAPLADDAIKDLAMYACGH